ncbi:hypothetical protein D3C81_2033910 [compost metagenome]
MRLPAVRRAFPVAQVTFVLTDDVHAAVGRPAVDDDVFQTRIALVQHRQNGAFQELGLVERRGHDGHFGQQAAGDRRGRTQLADEVDELT